MLYKRSESLFIFNNLFGLQMLFCCIPYNMQNMANASIFFNNRYIGKIVKLRFYPVSYHWIILYLYSLHYVLFLIFDHLSKRFKKQLGIFVIRIVDISGKNIKHRFPYKCMQRCSDDLAERFVNICNGVKGLVAFNDNRRKRQVFK